MLNVFDEKSFAFIFLVLMVFPAAPVPTGGITHIFELIVMLLCLQLMIGREQLWLPKFLYNKQLSPTMTKKILPFLLRRIKFVEKFSKQRGHNTIKQKWFRMQLGLVVFLFTFTAFFAPPFTNLDTLPSLGVVLISIGFIFDDILVILAGYLVGLLGIGLAITLGAGIVTLLSSLF